MGFIDSFQKMSVDDLRKEVINLLKKAYADGRIIVETLERRLNEAAAAQDKESLMALVADIPAPEEKPSGNRSSSASTGNSSDPWRTNRRVPRENQSFFSILGSSNRNGRWQPAKSLSCFTILGSIRLDFRDAEFPEDGVKINTGCILGSLDIIVPPGINIDLSGLPLLGHFDNKAEYGNPEAPTITIRGIAVLGGVEVKQKEKKKQKSRRWKNRFSDRNR